jgi:DNA-binding beta-propeller fold protein YncE
VRMREHYCACKDTRELFDVSVVNTATNKLEATIPVDVDVHGDPSHSLAVAPDGRHVYIGNSLSDTVSVIDTARFSR